MAAGIFLKERHPQSEVAVRDMRERRSHRYWLEERFGLRLRCSQPGAFRSAQLILGPAVGVRGEASVGDLVSNRRLG